MMDFENRSGAYIWVREHRKRRKPSFAGRHGMNIYIAVPVNPVFHRLGPLSSRDSRVYS